MMPDLVLLDIQMPIVDGFSALTQLRKIGELSRIPVIAITGNVMPPDLERIEQSGFNGIVHKPFRIDEMIKAVKSALNND